MGALHKDTVRSVGVFELVEEEGDDATNVVIDRLQCLIDQMLDVSVGRSDNIVSRWSDIVTGESGQEVAQVDLVVVSIKLGREGCIGASLGIVGGLVVRQTER